MATRPGSGSGAEEDGDYFINLNMNFYSNGSEVLPGPPFSSSSFPPIVLVSVSEQQFHARDASQEECARSSRSRGRGRPRGEAARIRWLRSAEWQPLHGVGLHVRPHLDSLRSTPPRLAPASSKPVIHSRQHGPIHLAISPRSLLLSLSFHLSLSHPGTLGHLTMS